MKKNQKGFGGLELILILVIVGLVGFIGYYVQHTKSNTNKNLSSATSASAKADETNSVTDPYFGWKRYCSTMEKACFKYPSDWKLDTSASSSGQDRANVTGPSGAIVSFDSNIAGLGGACDINTAAHIFINKVEQLPNVPRLYYVETAGGSQTSVDHMGVVDAVNGAAPKIGDTGQCLYYTTFTGMQTPANGVMFTGASTSNGDSLAGRDITTIQNIFKSYSY